jgi:hypothetical protein
MRTRANTSTAMEETQKQGIEEIVMRTTFKNWVQISKA